MGEMYIRTVPELLALLVMIGKTKGQIYSTEKSYQKYSTFRNP